MPFANPIIAAGVAGLHDLYAGRAVTPVEACEAYLSRIAGLDGALGAYVHVDAAGARDAAAASAERWRAGAPLSRLDGVPVSVKASIAVDGWPWHAGIGAHRDRLAQGDAGAVARLRQAGAVLLGLTAMMEGGYGPTADNPHFGRTHNPWSFDQTPGGSSGGAGAAVAAGLCAGALASDTLGSVRIPAAFNGVFGHKPTPGLAPADGLVATSWTFDQPGVLARSAVDAARLFAGLCEGGAELAAEIAEPADFDRLTESPFALMDLAGVDLSPETARAAEALLADAQDRGLTVERVSAPAGLDLPALRRLAMFVAAAESAVEHAEALAHDPEGFSPGYRRVLEEAGTRPARDLARAYRDLAAGAEAIREALSPYAGVLLPTTPGPAFARDADPPESTSQLTCLASLAGLPACAFPVGLTDESLPLSFQAVAWDDETALGLARVLGRELGAPPAYQG